MTQHTVRMMERLGLPTLRKAADWSAYAAVIFLALGAQQAWAKVSPEEAEKLKNGTLTPSGAEPGANADGTITAWEGGITTPPPGYPGAPEARYPNIFPNDKPKFVITTQNLDQYKDKLTPGQLALFAKFPDTYKMPVYETKRTFANNDWVYEWNYKNALNAVVTNEGNGFEGAAVGIPFPIPKDGFEPIWNHKARFRGQSVRRWNNQAAVTTSGNFNLATLQEDVQFWYNMKERTPDTVNNLLLSFMQIRHAPSRLRGEVLLVHETLDQVSEERRAWLYNPGQRRVRRAPNVGHDNPGTGADGLRTNDQTDMFNGSLERYTWKLVGKKEIYIPNNSYDIHQDKYKYEDLVNPGHMNQDPARYELHRVWVVDSNLKEGTSHIYGRRVYYISEDAWQMAVVDVYDKRGELWRVQEAHTIQAADPKSGIVATAPILEAIYDLQATRYLLQAMNNEHEESHEVPFDEKYFTTGNMKQLAPK